MGPTPSFVGGCSGATTPMVGRVALTGTEWAAPLGRGQGRWGGALGAGQNGSSGTNSPQAARWAANGEAEEEAWVCKAGDLGT